mmetsp:Transcript_22960/g.34823  ORF Transcript_22960/g.34823 Transcript_22960/m.34823 type:complete len:226 (+) Transcript_22960:932-1609(+)
MNRPCGLYHTIQFHAVLCSYYSANTILHFTRADGQCFIPPTLVHQSSEITVDLFMNVFGNWVTHATTSGYMDRDGWFKTIHNFTKLCGASESNPQYLYFDGHGSHWDADALDLMSSNDIYSFFLKAEDSENDQPNDNGPNAGLKDDKTWAKLLCRAGPMIVKAFKNCKLHPLIPPVVGANTAAAACTAAMHCAKGKKATEFSIISINNLGVQPISIIKNLKSIRN